MESLDGNPEPVTLEQIRRCHFKAKGCGNCGLSKGHPSHKKDGGTCVYKKKLGCAVCGANKGDPVHYGAPQSYNVFTTGPGNAMALISAKQAWQAIFFRLLRESDLPLGLDRVYVEGEITFPEHNDNRDQGNFRVLIEKALGDALEDGGWIVRDSWEHYEFGGLQKREVPGVSATRLMLFPSAMKPKTEFARSGEQMELT
jgi:hypothetical protein